MVSILSETNKEHAIIVDMLENKDQAQLEKFIKSTHWDLKYSNLDVI